jgi:hypothetical protein
MSGQLNPLNPDDVFAPGTPTEIVLRVRRDSVKLNGLPIDPTEWATIDPRVRRLVIAQALETHVRGLKFAHYFLLARLYFEQFILQLRRVWLLGPHRLGSQIIKLLGC